MKIIETVYSPSPPIISIHYYPDFVSRVLLRNQMAVYFKYEGDWFNGDTLELQGAKMRNLLNREELKAINENK